MLNEADILEALQVCYDPELQINIVDLGRIHTVHVERDTEAPGPTPRAHVTVALLPRDQQGDAMLSALVTNRLLGLREISQADVSVLLSPLWTPDRMNAAARAQRSKQQGLIQLGDAL